MGRYRGSGRATTSGYLHLDVRYLQRKGFLRPGSSSSQQWSCRGEPLGPIGLQTWDGYIVLSYSHRRDGEEWTSREYSVSLEWTQCNFGGSRAWFRCPPVGCGRRVAILYGGSVFACRQCHSLAYESQNETAHSRALSKTQAIRVKLGGGPCGDFPPKPKGMHWRTYNRLAAQAEDAEFRSWPPWMLCKFVARD
jgi:hypothetical protein